METKIFNEIAGVTITAFQKTRDIVRQPWMESECIKMIEEDRLRLINEEKLPEGLVNDAVQFGKQLARNDKKDA